MGRRDGGITVRGSRASGYGKKKQPAKYKCARCPWVYEEPEAGGTVCPNCGSKYVVWINSEDFIKRAEIQDAQLAAARENALRDAEAKAAAAFNRVKKKKSKNKDAKQARKRKK